MSFGVSISDIGLIIQLAKDTVKNARRAPSDFAEASRICQSLYLLLEAVQSEYENPDSPLHKDDRTRTDFAIHLRNCEAALKPLADLIAKYISLGTQNARFIDRLRFSKKDYLEYRGNLSFYTSKLSEFLQMVGLGSLGRIEQKVEHIKEHLPRLMTKIDQMCAELRLQGDKQSLLSDHTDDEKFVWKIFRRRLNQAGFTSHVLREHESEIFLRIRELTECGLLVSDGSSIGWTDNQPTRVNTQIEECVSRQGAEPTNASSARKGLSTQTASAADEQHDDRFLQEGLLSESGDTASPTTQAHEAESDVRTWHNLDGKPILKGKLAPGVFRSGKSFVGIIDSQNEEVLMSSSNMNYDDLAYAESVAAAASFKELSKKDNSDKDSDTLHERSTDTEAVEEILRGKDQPDKQRLYGKRSQIQIRWKYRTEGFELPSRPPVRLRSSLTNDALPKAAAKGDLGAVKRLLRRGEHIESKGPQSWTETIKNAGDEAPTTRRHSFPETTALYRAAHAGWIDVAQFLLENGADVDTRDGYDGRIGQPILFKVVGVGDEKMARLLLEYEAKISSQQFGATTALHIASSYPKRSLVRLLLDFDAYINAVDEQGKSPLYLASDGAKSGGFARNVELLLREGARTDTICDGGQTALYKASGKGRDDIVKLLLLYGANSNVGRGRYGETALFKAAWHNEIEVVELLLEFGADLDIKNNAKMEKYRGMGEKLLHGVMAAVSKDHAIMNNWGRTALHAAAFQGHKEIVEILLKAGADPEIRGNDGLTPLYLAAGRENEGIVQLLLKSGAKLDNSADPVLALLERRNQTRNADKKSIELARTKRQLDQIGTDDKLVGMIANLTQSFASSRRVQTSWLATDLLKLYNPQTQAGAFRP